jgi:hypothetical protein
LAIELWQRRAELAQVQAEGLLQALHNRLDTQDARDRVVGGLMLTDLSAAGIGHIHHLNQVRAKSDEQLEELLWETMTVPLAVGLAGHIGRYLVR